MPIEFARAVFGLSAAANPTAPNATGAVQIGPSATQISMPEATVGYSVRCVLVGTSTEKSFVLDAVSNDTSLSDAWVAGTAQVETAVAAGSITGAGTAAVVLTSAGMTGSPLTLNVAVAVSDTAAQWAEKVRVALAANAVVADRFAISGTGANIILTRKPIQTFPAGAETIPIYPINDGTLNLSLANGTSTGITNATESSNTTEGVQTGGALIFGGGGVDWEGKPLALMDGVTARIIEGDSGTATVLIDDEDSHSPISGKSISLQYYQDATGYDPVFTIQSDAAADFTITVFGKPA